MMQITSQNKLIYSMYLGIVLKTCNFGIVVRCQCSKIKNVIEFHLTCRWMFDVRNTFLFYNLL